MESKEYAMIGVESIGRPSVSGVFDSWFNGGMVSCSSLFALLIGQDDKRQNPTYWVGAIP